MAKAKTGKTKTTTTKAAGKPKQLRIEGTHRLDANPVIDKAAATFLESREAMKKHKDATKAKKSSLLALVKEHGLKDKGYVYEDDDGQRFKIKYEEATEEDVTVTKIKDDKDDDAGTDE